MNASSSAVTPERILQFGWAYAPPLAIEAAVRHGVFDVLDAGPLTLARTAAATGTTERGLKAVMNLLVSLGLLARTEDGCYALAPESSAFLVSSKPAFHGGLFRHMSSQLMPRWMQLSEIVASGKPAVSVNQERAGGEFFSDFVMDIFPLSYQAALTLAQQLAFGDTGDPVSVLDIAAGSAVWSIALAQSSPRVVATAVDWPEVLPTTRRSVARFGLTPRYTFSPGDLSHADFGHGHSVATLGHILHSEGAQRSQQLLRRTFDALAPGGMIAISEFLVNPERSGPVGSLIFAVNMLVNTDQGDTFTYDEIAGWLKEAGFVNPRTLEVSGPSPLILANRPDFYNQGSA